MDNVFEVPVFNLTWFKVMGRRELAIDVNGGGMFPMFLSECLKFSCMLRILFTW